MAAKDPSCKLVQALFAHGAGFISGVESKAEQKGADRGRNPTRKTRRTARAGHKVPNHKGSTGVKRGISCFRRLSRNRRSRNC